VKLQLLRQCLFESVKFPGFSMHKYNAHLYFLCFCNPKSWNVTKNGWPCWAWCVPSAMSGRHLQSVVEEDLQVAMPLQSSGSDPPTSSDYQVTRWTSLHCVSLRMPVWRPRKVDCTRRLDDGRRGGGDGLLLVPCGWRGVGVRGSWYWRHLGVASAQIAW
jgi:hypothetical protein